MELRGCSSGSLRGLQGQLHAADTADEDAQLDAAARNVDMPKMFNKVASRLLPLFFVMVVMCYIDRTSLAFAAIQLNSELGFSPRVYGIGSGLFFLGYSLLQVPSNLLLRRFGGPAWLAGIIFAWGIAATSFAFMSTVKHFYVLRLLLGIAESGAFPGMWYMISIFFPGDQVTFPFAVVEAGIALSHVVAAPLAAGCLSMDGFGGLAGWRWLFVVEGLPTLVLAVVMYRLLPSSPEEAKFLTPAERRALVHRIALYSSGKASSEGGAAKLAAGGHGGLPALGGGGGGGSGKGAAAAAPPVASLLRAAASNKWVWYLGSLKLLHDIAAFGVVFWTPTIVNALIHDKDVIPSGPATHHGHGETAGVAAVLLTALPFGLSSLVSLWLAHRSQRHNERILHVAVPYITAGAVFSFFYPAARRSQALGFATLVVGVVGVYSGSAATLALLSELAAGPGLVVAMPMYNSIGTIGGFVGPTLVGWLVQGSGGGSAGFATSTAAMGCALTASGLMVLALGVMLGRLGCGGRAGAAGAGGCSVGGISGRTTSSMEVALLDASVGARSGDGGGGGGLRGGSVGDCEEGDGSDERSRLLGL